MKRTEEGLLLLTCALGEKIQPLTGEEYRQLAVPAGKIREDGEVTVQNLTDLCCPKPLAEKACRLLDREEILCSYLAQPEMQVLTRLSEDYPRRLRALPDCPPVFFCRGDLSALRTPCVALVGARDIPERNRAFARHVGILAAGEGYTLVSGNAAGADTEAQEACLSAGGKVISFVADRLTDHPVRKNVLYCSDEGWDREFTSARALRRNHYIHALGEKTLVACCAAPRGGTWAGTRYNLLHGLSPVWMLKDSTEGARRLEALGAWTVDGDFPSIRALENPQLSIFDEV